MENKNVKFAFFGTDDFSLLVLNELKNKNFLPTLVVTAPDKPKGRKLVLTPPEVKIWAEENGVKFIQPKSLRQEKNPEMEKEIKSYAPDGFDLFVVASYGKIIPQNILDIPRRQTLNVHPSLLPKLRGPSPIESAILFENETGVTIMRLDAEMDHGPILARKKIAVADWPPYADDLEKILGVEGGVLLAEIIPDWLAGKISETEQDHSRATVCKKIEKIDGEINFSDSAETNLRKIRAYRVWPTAYFFQKHKDKILRVIVKTAHTENGALVLDRVVPEGKKEMSYADFQKGLR
jgi:methionyl-tRNA formyltransferase